MNLKVEIEGASAEEILRYREIFAALITCGGLTGVKGGKTILHFDNEGVFQGVELDYWPWRRRKS
jgi:hypothetical protein